tara:strand:+ start:11834 stop:12331 length:498 start_codon:yes stop_codon:yes gene_type:complete
MSNSKIAIIMGSESDFTVMQGSADYLKKFEIPYEITIVSAHRTPKRLYEFAKTAKDKGFKVIIAGAGGAAHLPGMVAALTSLPVIGVPIGTSALNGEDSLLSIVQMPPGVPVATMAINGSVNAAIFAAQILATNDQDLLEKVDSYKKDMEEKVISSTKKMEENDN